jgi:thioredoxin-like negative regulator of GroEL
VRTAAEKLAGSAAVIQINTADNPQLATRFGVTGIPVVYLLQRGEVVSKVAGAQTAESLLSWFRRTQGS